MSVNTKSWQSSAIRGMSRPRAKLVASLSVIIALLAVGISSFFVAAHFAHANPRASSTTNAAEDNFIRANKTGSWGTTSNTDGLTNYPWQRSFGSSPFVSINANVGDIAFTLKDGHKVAGYVATTPAQSGDVLARIRFSNIGGAEGGVNLDNNSHGSQWYQADMNTDLHTIELRKRFNGIMTTVASFPFTFTPNTTYWLRVDVQVSNGVAQVNGRAWLDGTTEPTTWQVSYTDKTPLVAGYPGAMGDWFRPPPAGTLTGFTSWSYATTGLAVPAK